jgi:putative transcriptional regulator
MAIICVVTSSTPQETIAVSEFDAESPESLAGYLLVASPELSDPNFAKSVVLIIHHDEEGAFGLVLTQPTKIMVAQVWGQRNETKCRAVDTIHRGGPVEGPLMALHGKEEIGGNVVMPGLFYVVAAEHLEQLVTTDAQPTRYFMYYSGWGAGQLDGELEAGGWLTIPARPEDLFQNAESLWEVTIRRIAGRSVLKSLGIAEFPRDPSAN